MNRCPRILVLLLLLPSLVAARDLSLVGDNWCPYNCAPDAAQKGYLIDIVERLFGKDYVIDYKLEPWSRAVKMVEDGERHMLVATTAETSRKLQSSIPLGIDRTCFFVRSPSNWRYGKMGDLTGQRIGVVQDYAYDGGGALDKLIARYRKTANPLLEQAYGQDALTGNFRKLYAGRMDVLIENENVGQFTITQLNLQDSIHNAGCISHHVATLHIGLTLGLPDGDRILGTLRDGVAQLRKSGELQTMMKKYNVQDWQPLLKHEK
jgi:polar amino acid transport system substrate-binding protein